MALMLVAVVCSGVVASKLLLLLGVGSMRTRYGLAVVVAYVVFFALIGLWLEYVRRIMFGSRATHAQESSSGSLLDLNVGSGSGSGSGVDVPRFSSGGGRFGGGGASGSFADADVASPTNVTASSAGRGGSGGGSSWGFDFDLDDGIWIVIAFLIFVAILALAGGWIIYDAPSMFGEAAFECFLASGLLRGTKALKGIGWPAVAIGGWQAVVARRTVIPFLIVAVAAVVFGHFAQQLCPGARSLIEALRLCVDKS